MSEPSPSPQKKAPTPRRILIADANKSRFTELITGLNAAGIEVLHVAEKNQVVAIATSLKPDLIIINLFLSSSNTLGTIKELRATLDAAATKIIVLTSHYSKDNILECVRSGASDFILEPFQTQLILDRIRYQLQERAAFVPEELKSQDPADLMAGFQLVYDCLRISTEIKDIHMSLHESLKKVAELSSSTRVNVMVGDIETDKGSILASSDDPKLENLAVNLEKYPEVREVLLKNSIVYVKDITQNPLTRSIKDNVKSIDITSILVFPIRHRQETIGTLNIRLGKKGMDVTDKHLKTFYMVALSISSKVATKKLLKKLKT